MFELPSQQAWELVFCRKVPLDGIMSFSTLQMDFPHYPKFISS